jgi:glycosyltransferase involved in cell wall biosynthesis
MSEGLLVSIITPSYNQGNVIEETIRSVLGQSYPWIEHVVVDGGSTDQTVAILQKYGGQVRWLSERDRGQAHALNKGFRLARGRIFGWINADDVYFDEDVVVRVVECLGSRQEVGAVYGDVIEMDGGGRLQRVCRAPDFKRSRLLRYNYIAQPTVFFRREVAEKYPLNEALHYVLDTDWFIRVSQEYLFQRIPRLQACFRRHPQSKLYLLGADGYAKECRWLRETYGGSSCLDVMDLPGRVWRRLVGRVMRFRLDHSDVRYYRFLNARAANLSGRG